MGRAALLLARGLLFALLLPVRRHPPRGLCSLFRSLRTARCRRLFLARRSLRSPRTPPCHRLPPPPSARRRSCRTTAKRVDRLLQGIDIFPQLVQERRYLRLPGGHAVGDGLTDPLGELISCLAAYGRPLTVSNLSANALSKALDVPVNRITAILNGQRGVTADTALRLGALLRDDADGRAEPAVRPAPSRDRRWSTNSPNASDHGTPRRSAPRAVPR